MRPVPVEACVLTRPQNKWMFLRSPSRTQYSLTCLMVYTSIVLWNFVRVTDDLKWPCDGVTPVEPPPDPTDDGLPMDAVDRSGIVARTHDPCWHRRRTRRRSMMCA